MPEPLEGLALVAAIGKLHRALGDLLSRDEYNRLGGFMAAGQPAEALPAVRDIIIKLALVPGAAAALKATVTGMRGQMEE